MPNKEQEYKDYIKELEQQIRLLKEQGDFLTRKLYGIKSEKTSTLEIEGEMSLFNEIESSADPDAPEPDLVEVEKHLRKKKYAGQREELVQNIPYSKVLHTIDESEQICEKCGSTMVKVGEEFVRTEVQFIPAKLKVIDHYRETYECRSCRKRGTPYMEKAPAPYPPVMHSLASASTIAWLIHQKFELGIPLYCQEKEWEGASRPAGALTERRSYAGRSQPENNGPFNPGLKANGKVLTAAFSKVVRAAKAHHQKALTPKNR